MPVDAIGGGGSSAELEPAFNSSPAKNVTTTDITNLSNLSGVNTGDQDLSGYALKTKTFNVGETVAMGQICYLKSDGNMWKSLASVEATTKGLLGITLAGGSAGASILFLMQGDYTDSGLTIGAEYYISVSTAGAKTSIRPSATGNIVRILGYATSATNFYFNPDGTYVRI